MIDQDNLNFLMIYFLKYQIIFNFRRLSRAAKSQWGRPWQDWIQWALHIRKQRKNVKNSLKAFYPRLYSEVLNFRHFRPFYVFIYRYYIFMHFLPVLVIIQTNYVIIIISSTLDPDQLYVIYLCLLILRYTAYSKVGITGIFYCRGWVTTQL